MEYVDYSHIWKPIPNSQRYFINPMGEICNRDGLIMKACDKNGYKRINLSFKGVRKGFFVHRLVAMVYTPNPENKPVVNHKDGNPSNNHVDNLEWATCLENTRHAIEILGKQVGRKEGERVGYATKKAGMSIPKLYKPVAQYDLKDNYLQTFESLKEAAEVVGVSGVSIHKAIFGVRGRVMSAGFKWRYAALIQEIDKA